MSPLYRYNAVDQKGTKKRGVIDAASKDIAISALQKRGLIVYSVTPVEGKKESVLEIDFFNRVSPKDIVMLFQQMDSLFEAQISALNAFRMLASETQNPVLKRTLFEIVSDIQSGLTISKAMSKHPKVFSPFYVSVIKAGEETGRLNESFAFLADYINRTYEISSKARNALIYPAFVIITFIAVMTLMLTTVIPKLSSIIVESGMDVPFYTQVVMGVSNFLSHNLIILLIGLLIVGVIVFRYLQTNAGKKSFAQFKMSVPYIGDLYKKLYLSRIADSLSTSLSSGLQMVRSISIASEVVEDPIYKDILTKIAEEVRAGESVSQAFRKYPQQFPGIFVGMLKVGEESGNMSSILKSIAGFYKREVFNAIETLVSLIEPVMIVLLGLGVGLLLASVLIPIYNLSTSI